MKAIASLFLLLICMGSKMSKAEDSYVGSTPAGTEVKAFLGIPLQDSVDFIAWKLVLFQNGYTIQCNYQVLNKENGKVTTNKEVLLSGKLVRGKNDYIIHNGEQTMKLARLHPDLLHFANTDNDLLTGNGGWSYTINHSTKTSSSVHFFNAKAAPIKDSVVFIGRTPCEVPGVNLPGNNCIKLKWKIVFFGNRESNQPGSCKVYATPYRQEIFKPGTWKMITTGNGRIFYHLYDKTGTPFLYLEKANENILLFTDASGNLLIGDKDYSFTLNRRM